MAIITAYLLCNSLTPNDDTGEDREVYATFFPDRDDPRNADWARWMPDALLSMTLRGTVGDQLAAGQPYVMQITTEGA